MKISKILAGISAMAVAATMALSASAATTLSISNPEVSEWGSAFPKWTDGTQEMDDYIDGKTFTKGQPLEVKITYEYTQDAKDAFADDDENNNYAILKPCHAAQGWASLVQEGFIEGLNAAGTWDYAESGVGYTIKDTGETVPVVAQSSDIVTNDPNNNVITFTVSAAGVDAIADAANASAEAYDGIQIQVFGIDVKSIELSQDGVKLASQYSGGQSTGDVSADSSADGSTSTDKPGSTTTDKPGSTTSTNSTGSTTGSTSTNKGTTTSTSTTADNTANTGATAGIALAGLALAGVALVVSKKK